MSGKSIFADHKLWVSVGVRVRIKSHSQLTYSPQVSGHWSCNSDTLCTSVVDGQQRFFLPHMYSTSVSDGKYH